jgi:hypothetical protein
VETWDRELVVSVFVHLAVGENTLYVEWKPYVLLPIHPAYKAIDDLSSNQLIPLGQAVWRLVTLPASMPSRIGHLVRWLRPLPDKSRRRKNPDRYGSLRTAREMGADEDVQNYLQVSDVYRYLKILESRFVQEVSDILHKFGYSSTTFDQVTASAAVRNLYIGNTFGNTLSGNFNAPVMTGGRVAGNVTGSGSMSVPPPRPPAQH